MQIKKLENISIVRSLRRSSQRFLKIRGNPSEIALGLSLGLFVGMSPYMGLQTAIAVFLAALFKWNKLAAAAGVWISNPFTAPFLYSLTYWLGSAFYKAKPAEVITSESGLQHFILLIKIAPGFLFTLTIGGIIVGIPLALGSYYLAYSAIIKYRQEIKVKLVRKKRAATLSMSRKRKHRQHPTKPE